VKEKLGAALVCLVFALPFGGVGAGAAYAIYGTIRDGIAAREWVRVKAEVMSHGNGSVLYRYVMDGKSYTGDRLGTNVIGGTDNVDSWHEDMDSMLAAARSEGRPITVFVNPDDPTQSMVDNTIRWKLGTIRVTIEHDAPIALGDKLEIISHVHPAGSTDQFGAELADRTVTTLTYAVGDETKAVASLFAL